MKKNCFVLMPFDKSLKEVYELAYRKACKKKNTDCKRMDENHAPGSITKNIINSILDADFIIADLTSLNANVFYELAFAHTMRKPVIMTTQESRNDAPFDIKTYHIIRYEQSITGMDTLLKDLVSAITKVLNTPPENINNPIIDAMQGREDIIPVRQGEQMTVPLNKGMMKQIIRLHKRSSKYLTFVILDDALRDFETGIFTGNSPQYTDYVYDRIEKSAKECAGFSGRCINDVLEFLRGQFKREMLSEIIDSIVTILKYGDHSLAHKRQLGQKHIEINITLFFNRIEAEIDRLYSLRKCE